MIAAESAPVCLVSMPFTPVMMPALGVSLLKAELNQVGINADVVYCTLALLEHFERIGTSATALTDYSLLATTRQCGDLFFARAFWRAAAPHRDRLVPFFEEAAGADPSGAKAATLHRLLAAEEACESFLDACFRSRDWNRYRIVGFSSSFSQQIASLWLARRIKETCPDVLIVFGGANCDGDMGRAVLAAFPFVDHVIQGEADVQFPAYVAAVLAESPLDTIGGLLVRRNGAVIQETPPRPVTDMGQLPVPDFSDFFNQLPRTLSRDEIILPFETSRGCWWGEKSHCVFCGLNPSTMSYRSKTPIRALSEIDALRQRWDIVRLAAVDNILDPSYFREVLPQLAQRGVSLFYETKSNLKEWHVARLAEAGVCDIQPGIEGLNSRLLKLMRKGVRRHQNVELLKWCRTYGVAPLWLYLYGFPGEDPDDYLDDAALMPRLVHLAPPKTINPVTIDRFSPLYTQREGFGVTALRPTPDIQLAYAGLDEATIASLAYHFDADVRGMVSHRYLGSLLTAHRHWVERNAAGAFLHRLCGDSVTLVVDGRDPEDRRAHLFAGPAHRVFRAMHTAVTRARLAALLEGEAVDDEDLISERDLDLSLSGIRMGAEAYSLDPTAAGALDRFIAQLEEAHLVVRCDDLWLALATDIINLREAEAAGLTQLTIACAPEIPQPVLRGGQP
jgi:ribosomal peptide maturation radical SAM protein 1